MMALPLEATIMEEIGLGNHYSYYNGSGSCQFIRKKAADKLQIIIKEYRLRGEIIGEADARLCAILKQIASNGDQSEFSLTNTWKAASYIVAEHIHQAKATPQKREVAYKNLALYLQQSYLPHVEDSRFCISDITQRTG